MALKLGNGRYPVSRVTLTDAVGRTAAVSVPAIAVDTVAPPLRVSVDPVKTGHGRLGLGVVTEPGARVVVRAFHHGHQYLGESFVAGVGPRVVERRLTAGRYRVEVVAGNATTWNRSVEIAVPLSLAAWLLLGLLLGVVIVVAWVLWSRRFWISGWWQRQRAARAERALVRERVAAEAAQARVLAEYARARTAFERADAAWRERRTCLLGLVELAETVSGTSAEGMTELKPRRGEKILTSVAGAMVEERSRQGRTVTVGAGEGTVMVSTQRVAFIGAKNREWIFDKITQKVDVGEDTTMLTVQNRKSSSGVVYPGDAERTRIIIDVAVAEANTGSRAEVVARVQRSLVEHDRARPVPPQPPPAPARPVTEA